MGEHRESGTKVDKGAKPRKFEGPLSAVFGHCVTKEEGFIHVNETSSQGESSNCARHICVVFQIPCSVTTKAYS